MIPLLELALDAHGGLTRWRQVKSIDLKLSIGGQLRHAKGLPQGLNVALHVERSGKLVAVSPFDGEDSTGYFTPDRVWVENAAGTVVQELTLPRGSFSGHDLMTPWSKLQELYFVGYAFLNYLSSPFNLAEPGFEVAEIEPHEENGETWRRMVVRFPGTDGPVPPPPPAPVQVAMISSEPGQLAGKFSFASEENLLISSFAADVPHNDQDPPSSSRPLLPSATFTQWKDPTLAELSNQLATQPSDVVHFCGIDGWQGAALLGMPASDAYDGVFLPDEGGAPIIASADSIAGAVCAGKPPSLVGFNFYYSSANTAALTVAKGAGAAIGFQDDTDDALAERFFTIFYDVWYQGRDVIAAYQAAFAGLASERGRLRGSGIVLWSAKSLLQPQQTTKAPRLKPRPFPLLQPGEVPDHRTAVMVELTECARLNYSMLHNNRPLFEIFRLKRQGRGAVQGDHVQVILHAGTEEANYEASFDLTESVPIVDVNNSVRVSLTSELSRSLQESIMTSLYVSITWGQHIILQRTYRVALLPTDEWQDDDLNRIWLPNGIAPGRIKKLVAAVGETLWFPANAAKG